jgi:hypothetical protein
MLRIELHGAAMPRFLILAGVILLMADYSFAQDYSPDPTPAQCQLIKQAVAQYGYAASRRYALENYGPEAAKTGDKCFTKRAGRGNNLRALGIQRRRNSSCMVARTIAMLWRACLMPG